MALEAPALTPAQATPPQAAPQTGPLIVDRDRPDRAPPATGETPARRSRVQGAGGRVAHPQQAVAPFVLRGIRLEGATAPERLIAPVARRFVGRRLDTAGLTRLAEAVSKAYGKSDVALYTVLIPAQDFAHGVVRVRVVEGWVEAVDVRAKDGGRAPRVAAYARRLLREKPLRRSSLDHVLLLMRSLPGTTVDVQFLRGAHDGAVRMAVTVTTKRVQFGVGISDRGANLLGRTQLEADLTLNSLLREGDRTTLTLATPTDVTRFRFYQLSHSQPIGDSGLLAQASVGYLQTRPRGTHMQGSATLGSLGLTYPLQLQADRSLFLSASVDMLDSRNALFGETLTDERVRTARVSGAYTRAYGSTASLSLGVTGSQGIGGIGSRPIAPGYSDTDFRKLSVQAAAAKSYGKWTVRLRGEAQASDGRLPASEQLALGGEDFGRAFPSAVATGDEGAAGSAELAYGLSALLPKVLHGTEAYAYVDGGRVRQESRDDGVQGATYDVASAGLGARLAVADHAAFQLELSRQLVARTPAAADPDWRLVFGYRTAY